MSYTFNENVYINYMTPFRNNLNQVRSNPKYISISTVFNILFNLSVEVNI